MNDVIFTFFTQASSFFADAYGTASADFTLPATGLNGSFSVQSDLGQGATRYFRVEEYKRPTFKVEFDEVKQEYRNGDTLVVKGRAMTFAGVPVQGAKVSYTVSRSGALWWRFMSYGNGDIALFSAAIIPFASKRVKNVKYFAASAFLPVFASF